MLPPGKASKKQKRNYSSPTKTATNVIQIRYRHHGKHANTGTLFILFLVAPCDRPEFPTGTQPSMSTRVLYLAAAAPPTATADRPISVLFRGGGSGVGGSIVASLVFLWFRAHAAVLNEQVVVDSRGTNHLLQGLANQKVDTKGAGAVRRSVSDEKGT